MCLCIVGIGCRTDMAFRAQPLLLRASSVPAARPAADSRPRRPPCDEAGRFQPRRAGAASWASAVAREHRRAACGHPAQTSTGGALEKGTAEAVGRGACGCARACACAGAGAGACACRAAGAQSAPGDSAGNPAEAGAVAARRAEVALAPGAQVVGGEGTQRFETTRSWFVCSCLFFVFVFEVQWCPSL